MMNATLIKSKHYKHDTRDFWHPDTMSCQLICACAHLNLPVELNVRGDVNVDTEVHEFVHAVVVEGVETLLTNQKCQDTF